MRKFLVKLFTTSVWMLFFASTNYVTLYARVYFDDGLLGAYSPLTNTYACMGIQSVCEHERGHAVDYHNMPFSFIWADQRSVDKQFRADVDRALACTQTIFADYDILHTEYPKTSESLMAIEWMTPYYNDNENKKYREIYAELYEIMKIHRWDEYHYEDVEDMITQHATHCQQYLDRVQTVSTNE